MLDDATLYAALVARDRRFDGLFFVGVTSTGIYCRPVCPARTPRSANCRFFPSAAAAEAASFRPCLRCRPELAPGRAPIDDAERIAALLVERIEQGAVDGSAAADRESAGLESLAARFGWSSRQIRRIVRRQLGVAPIELVQTRRLLLAKQLLTETTLPVTEVAAASGFASLRRFHDAFRRRYRMTPRQLRRVATERGAPAVEAETLTLRLGYRPPFDWAALLDFLRPRALDGVESVGSDSYARTIDCAGRRGWLRVRHCERTRELEVELARSLVPVLPVLLSRVRRLFDLDARPDLIAAHLSTDRRLAAAVDARPGLRVPGGVDGFELALRAILGQQVSVRAATTLAARLVAAFGEQYSTPDPALHHLTPTPARLAAAEPGELSALGILPARSTTLITLAREVAEGRLTLDRGVDPAATVQALVALPGIGPWTAHYIALRALSWTDAFPKEDLVLRRQLGGVTPARAEAISQPWRPWRSYATLYLWQSASGEPK